MSDSPLAYAIDYSSGTMRWPSALLIASSLIAIGLGVCGCGFSCEWLAESRRDGRPRNVLLITIDTLRPDRLGYSGYERDTSPAMDALSAEGISFTTAYSQAGWTLPSIATVLTGRHPSDHGALDKGHPILRELPTLASLLRASGFETRAFVSHVILGPEHGLAGGFDSYDSSVLDIGHPHKVSTASELTDLALAALEATEEPFFLWVHYFDPHFAYRPKQVRFGLKLRDRYDAEIAFTDGAIGRLLEGLAQSELDEDTLVVLTADHGEQFGEHGGTLHFGLYEEELRIPLIFKGPGIEPERSDLTAQQIDILPTVLAQLGIEPPADLPGRDLLGPAASTRPVFTERTRPTPFLQSAVIDGDKKLYRVQVAPSFEGDILRRSKQTGISPGIRLFDLAADPGEQHDLYDEHDPEAQRLLEMLDEFQATRPAARQPLPVDEELQRKLRSLGYLE